jgi:hypothetical protein
MGDSMSTIINATTTNGVVIQPDNSGSLVLQTNSGTTALTISTAQNATFAAQATIPTINLSGGQITFPATQSPSANANTLDDYEEGTWTPANATVTLSTALGSYTKIGNTILLRGLVTYPVNASAAGAALTGLPFAAGGSSDNFNGAVCSTNNGTDNRYIFVYAGTSNILVRDNTNTDIALSSVSNAFFNFISIYNV